jgi:hypothetical protein
MLGLHRSILPLRHRRGKFAYRRNL